MNHKLLIIKVDDGLDDLNIFMYVQKGCLKPAFYIMIYDIAEIAIDFQFNFLIYIYIISLSS